VSDAAGRESDSETRAIPEEVGDWSISSLLAPPISALPRGEPLAEAVLQLEACPIATRSAIHVVVGSGGGRAGDIPSAGCSSSSTSCGAVGAQATASGAAGSKEGVRGQSSWKQHVITRVIPPSSAGEATRTLSLSDFLRRRFWGAGIDGSAGDHDETQKPAGAAAKSSTISGDGSSKGTAAGAATATAAEPTPPAVARLDHYLSGRGGTRGVSVSSLVNMHPTSGAFVDFLQPVPYFMVPLLGTLRARLTPSSSPASSPPPLENPTATAAAGPLVSLARNITLTPGDGRRATVVEARVWVPAASTLVLGFDFFKRFLTVDDFPPDPSRGFDVPPPFARFSFADANGGFEVGGEPAPSKATTT
ncbi:unnamed protein product, partial [Hapterophycus canaliculatus]